MKKFICVICFDAVHGYPSNAAPVANGNCCQDCDVTIVIPTRLLEVERMLRMLKLRKEIKA